MFKEKEKKMDKQVSKSINRNDYEILIRKRGESEYASYCPQLNLILDAEIHEEAAEKMEERIEKHINSMMDSKD